MDIEVIKPGDLSADLVERWRAIQEDRWELQSPYLCPEFVQSLGRVRDQVLVGLVRADGEVVGFFPFEKTSSRSARPPGGPLCDIHGPLLRSGIRLPLSTLVKGCGLLAYRYPHLYDGDPEVNCHEGVDHSHFIDLSQGFAAYSRVLEERGSKMLKDVNYKARKLGRDFGSFRFVPSIEERSVLDTLIAWKSEQYRSSGLVDVFSFDWTRQLLHLLLEQDTEHFAGVLSGIYAGDELLALHMGMRSRRVWNWWFPRHDNKYKRYSPGIILRMRVAEHAAERGMARIDLGCGDETTYKPRLATGSLPLYRGVAHGNPLFRWVDRSWRGTVSGLRRSPLRAVLRFPSRLVRRVTRGRKFK